ncbi:MAG: FAD-binding oxidoreductase [Psychrobium sp.]|nr:FAD-binding oxidoreductase [Psychrobium sp.]
MLPKLSVDQLIDQTYLLFLQDLEKSEFSGDIEQDYGARLAVSTDNSIYQNLPQGVVFPKSTNDLLILTKWANKAPYNTITFSARGGGTGTNGQSLNNGIIVDLSRHMNNILEINEQQGWVRVQTGVIKDQLNKFLKPYGYFFSPDLSTSNRATLGGMISTDASGQGSLVYGKTSDHVLELTSVLINGQLLETKNTPIDDIEQAQNTHTNNISKQVAAICRDNRQLILDKFPRLNRFLTGYDLENVFNDDLSEFNLSRILTGSEGSLAFITEAKLNITKIPKQRTLINIIYDSFDSALRDAPKLVQASATSVETVDSKVLGLAKQDIIWDTVHDLIPQRSDKITDGLNMVEFASNDETLQQQRINSLCERLDNDIAQENGGILGYQICSELGELNRIYAMRKKSVGLLGATKGFKKPIAFAEDTAVPPEKLADFIVEFRALLDSHDLKYGMFGHVDAGVLHVRPAMDMCDEMQEKRLLEISDQVVALTAKYGGLMWGEHGKGYRSQYGPEFFGEQLFEKLRVIKSLFDPDNRLNPGKICTPINSDAQLVQVSDLKRGAFDRQIPISVRTDFTPAMSCNGNGQCFNFDVDSPMCPSSKVTKDRRHSPKGRATMMREWLRLLSVQGVDPVVLEKNDCSASLLSRIKNSWRKKNGEYDFSHEVMDVMKGCLACKACASQCPIKVDVPGFRSRFINLYHQRYLRPLNDHVVANVEMSSQLMSYAPRLSNVLVNNPLSKVVIKALLGMVDSPNLSVPSLNNRLNKSSDFDNSLNFDLAALSAVPIDERAQYVLVVQDPFTSFYDASVVESMLLAIKKLGFKPVLLPFKPNGKPAHVKGFLTKFANFAKNASDFFSQLSALGYPLVGVDPSLVLCYRDEYRQVLGDECGDFNVLLFQEWLTVNLSQVTVTSKNNDVKYQLFAHCSEKTAVVSTHQDWQHIFAKLGLSLTSQEVGCCGMAGTYGHEKQNIENSKELYRMSWQHKVAKVTPPQVLATGYSCRSQVARLDGFKPKHPVQIIAEFL